MSLWERILTLGRSLFSTTDETDNAETLPSVHTELACAPDPDDVRFTAAVVGLSAKLAKVDGLVTDDEVAMFSRVFRSTPQEWPAVRRVFDMARQTVRGYESYARQIGKRYADRPCLLEGVLDGLFHIAGADGVVTVEEIDYLHTVSTAFGFSDDDFRRIRATHLGPDPDDPYIVLGVAHDASFEAIRTAYRRLMADFHPDRIIAQGLPTEYENAANEKAAAINSAFARIKADRGFLIRDT